MLRPFWRSAREDFRYGVFPRIIDFRDFLRRPSRVSGDQRERGRIYVEQRANCNSSGTVLDLA